MSLTRSLAAATALLLAVGCSCGSSAKLCKQTSDCGVGQRCGGSGKCETAECKADGDCAGKVGKTKCTAGTCVAECTTSADCAGNPKGAVCDKTLCGSTCDPAVPGECAATEKCAPASKTCVVPACVKDADCTAADTKCDLDTYTCVCKGDGACRAGQTCQAGVCGPAQTCATDADCTAPQKCLYGACLSPCAGNGDCQGGGTVTQCKSGQCELSCLADQTCPNGYICAGNPATCEAAQCKTLGDCPSGKYCNDATHGRCIPLVTCTDASQCPTPATQKCAIPDPCPPGMTCSDKICIDLTPCAIDDNCKRDEYCDLGYCRPSAQCGAGNPCTTGFDCVGGTCVPHVCRGDAECAGQCSGAPVCLCSSGTCTPGSTAVVDAVNILTPGGPLAIGDTKALVAIATSGGKPVLGALIEWATCDISVTDPCPANPVLSVNTAGIVTGLAEGSAGIYAYVTVTGTKVVSAPAKFRIWQPTTTAGTFRVLVVDAESGAPLTGAIVVGPNPAGPGTSETPVDASGTATFVLGGSATQASFAAYGDGRDAVSVLDTHSQDVVLPLPLATTTAVGGALGTIDTTAVSVKGPAHVGLAGVSRRELVGISPAQLFGEQIVEHLSVQGQNINAPLPAGVSVVFDFQSPLGTFPIQVKSVYEAAGEKGSRAIWGFGGNISQQALFGAIGGGGAANALVALLPYFQSFDHDLALPFTVTPVARVPDDGSTGCPPDQTAQFHAPGCSDLNGNGRTDDLVPNYAQFAAKNLRPIHEPILRLDLTMPVLPSLGGKPVDSGIVTAGAQVPGIGFVPLGITAAGDQDGDGTIDTSCVTSGGTTTCQHDLRMKMVPLYGGLEANAYTLLVLALRAPAGAATGGMPDEVSARLYTAATLPTTFAVPAPFVPFAEGATLDRSLRQSQLSAADHAALSGAGVQVVRFEVQGAKGRLIVFGKETSTPGTLLPGPAAASWWTDPLSQAAADAPAKVQPILLDGVDLDDLAGLGGTTLVDYEGKVAGYSRSPVP